MATWLCLHGFTGTPACFRELGSAGALLAPELLGHGATPAAGWEASFEAEVARLARWLSEHSRHAVHLLGYSLGARLGLGLLRAHPERFRSALLVGANPGLRTAHERAERLQSDAELRQLLLTRGLEAFVDHWERLPLFATQSALSHAALAEQRRARLTHTAAGLGHALAALGLGNMPDYWPELAKLDLPVTLVVGEQDTKFRRLGETMLELLPSARLELAPGAGHNVVLERPAWLAGLMLRAAESAGDGASEAEGR
ncbi:MAG TPA: alpha/beta fold hydrolase [Polyangiaceae bacterium]|nr:alpha/beta fold hydrolase [Polyangiaceae bacterium]